MGERPGTSKKHGVFSNKLGVLTMCGLGINRPHDTTLGTIQALKECDVMFYIHGDGELLKPFLRTFCSDIRLFTGGKYDALTDERRIEIVAADVRAELKKGKNVAYVTYGHPMVFSDGFNVMKLCLAGGFECRVLPAPSAVDSIIAANPDLAELFSNGFLACTGDAAIGMSSPQRIFPVVILCLDRLVRQGLYGSLCDRIEGAYAAEHRVFAVKCGDSNGDAVRLAGRVSDLRGWETKIVHMMSLLVPACGMQPS